MSLWSSESVHLYYEMHDDMIHLEISGGLVENGLGQKITTYSHINIILTDSQAEELMKGLHAEGVSKSVADVRREMG